MSPMPAEGLTPDSNDRDIQLAISDTIKACMKEGGKDQKQCAVMAYGMARQATGKDLNYGKQKA